MFDDIALRADDKTQKSSITLCVDVAGYLRQRRFLAEGAAADSRIGKDGVGQQLVRGVVGPAAGVARRVRVLE
ncbi:hypothetical protein D9M68_932520 [compost metagenome]